MAFAVGALVKARGREWIVLPGTNEEILMVRPLGGYEAEETAILPQLEEVNSANFALPDPEYIGDNTSCRLLRSAIRIGLRSAAGPFRSFARLAVEPRPYQLVPLLMALKLDPVRMLLADDVGIGKTIEACMIARELLDRGEIKRIAVLCPPHLAEQWQKELQEKFQIYAVTVLPGTAHKLERQCMMGESIFERYPYVVVSTDFIKMDRRRDEFLRTCPEFVIVDEAHTCAYSGQGRSAGHQRYTLLKRLATRQDRHLVLVTATPHSGDENAFRSLLSTLSEDFGSLPEDMSGKQNEKLRRQLAKHFIQRRRADIKDYLQENTPFPEREETEEAYKLHQDYRMLFDMALDYARNSIAALQHEPMAARIQWWSLLALLRALASSPAAAVDTLRNRAGVSNAETIAEADEIGYRTVLDVDIDQAGEAMDITPGSDGQDKLPWDKKNKAILLEMARMAKPLFGDKDNKMLKAAGLVKKLIEDGYKPIIFCRFISTAEYLVQELRKRLPKNIEIAAVTGQLPPAEREERIIKLAEHDKYVLVATDCLSEGINLQEHFNAVFHYDLSWNPTRHEQREGRIDRYGQQAKKVRVVTYYGVDNMIDGIVLDVLIRKHKVIRNSLGISIQVPAESSAVLEAVMEGLILRGKKLGSVEQISFFDLGPGLMPMRKELFDKWELVSQREKRSRTLFAQETIRFEEVARELEEARSNVGSREETKQFVQDALRGFGAVLRGDEVIDVDYATASQLLKDRLHLDGRRNVRYSFKLSEWQDAVYLTRTHPVVEGLADLVFNTALDTIGNPPAKRCGVIRTDAVKTRTTLLLLRLRYNMHIKVKGNSKNTLIEECHLAAFRGAPENADWLKESHAHELLNAVTRMNVPLGQAKEFVRKVIDGYDSLLPTINEIALNRAETLQNAHRRVRAEAKSIGTVTVSPQYPVDVVGIYVFLPAGGDTGVR